MMKKILTGTFLMAFIVTNGIAGYAIDNADIPDKPIPVIKIEDANIVNKQNSENAPEILQKMPDSQLNIDKQVNSEEEVLEIKPENAMGIEIFEPKDKLITTDKVILFSGKGLEGTKVLIKVYSIPELVKSDFTFDNLPEDDVYILSLSQIIQIGPSGVFGEELELKLGLNKIVVYVEEAGEDAEEAGEDAEEAGEDTEEASEDTEEASEDTEEASEDVSEEQNGEEDINDSEGNEDNSSFDKENINENIEKTKIIEKYVYIQDISKAKEKLDSIKEPGSNLGLDIPSKPN